MTFKKIALIVAATGLLGACGGLELGTAKHTAPTGDAFSKALYKEYIALSQDEYNEGDYEDSDGDTFTFPSLQLKRIDEAAPPGQEDWIKDRKAEFKKRYGKDWEKVLYATAWKQHNNE
ncbi:MAG: hypothetical protein EBU57_13575, partial [Alphaproteobacteria bacterium]|nr:hypothetical protein [Alphaproteobacteria bacterium]